MFGWIAIDWSLVPWVHAQEMDRGKKAQKPHQPTHKLNQEIISNRWPKELEFLPEDTTTNPTRKMIVQNKRISGGLVAINAARTCQNPSNLHRIAPLLRVPKFRAELAVGIVGNRREPPGMAGKNRAPPGTAGNAREAPGTAGDRRRPPGRIEPRWGPLGTGGKRREAPGRIEQRRSPVGFNRRGGMMVIGSLGGRRESLKNESV